MAEWSSEYFPEIQRVIRYIGWKTINEDEPMEKVHELLKLWGDALQTITNPKPSPPPTLKAWLDYKWEKFKVRTDKWSILQWQLVIIGITACIFFSSMHQKMTMDLDRTIAFSIKMSSLTKRERRTI